MNTLFLLEAGLDIFEAFVANAMFTLGSVVFEIPTGILADTRGRRASFLVSVVILFLTTLAYVGVAELGGGLIAFSVVSVLIGLGFTFYSGAMEAWLVDALKFTGYEKPLDRVFARGSMITGGAMLVGSVGGAALGTLDLSAPFLVRAALLAVVFVMAWTMMEELGFEPKALSVGEIPAQMKKIGRESARFGVGSPPLRLLLASGFVQSGFLMWAWYAWQPYFLELWGSEAIWIAGMVSAGMSISTIIGNGLVERLTRFCGRRSTIMGWAVAVQAMAAIGVGLAPSFLMAVACLMVLVGSVGVMGPVRSATIHRLADSEHRASVVSLASMAGNGGSIFGQLGLGWLARSRSIPEGYVVGGACLTPGSAHHLVVAEARRRVGPNRWRAGRRGPKLRSGTRYAADRSVGHQQLLGLGSARKASALLLALAVLQRLEELRHCRNPGRSPTARPPAWARQVFQVLGKLFGPPNLDKYEGNRCHTPIRASRSNRTPRPLGRCPVRGLGFRPHPT